MYVCIRYDAITGMCCVVMRYENDGDFFLAIKIYDNDYNLSYWATIRSDNIFVYLFSQAILTHCFALTLQASVKSGLKISKFPVQQQRQENLWAISREVSWLLMNTSLARSSWICRNTHYFKTFHPVELRHT